MTPLMAKISQVSEYPRTYELVGHPIPLIMIFDELVLK